MVNLKRTNLPIKPTNDKSGCCQEPHFYRYHYKGHGSGYWSFDPANKGFATKLESYEQRLVRDDQLSLLICLGLECRQRSPAIRAALKNHHNRAHATQAIKRTIAMLFVGRHCHWPLAHPPPLRLLPCQAIDARSRPHHTRRMHRRHAA